MLDLYIKSEFYKRETFEELKIPYHPDLQKSANNKHLILKYCRLISTQASRVIGASLLDNRGLHFLNLTIS